MRQHTGQTAGEKQADYLYRERVDYYGGRRIGQGRKTPKTFKRSSVG